MPQTHFSPGEWNAICDLCGRKQKSNSLTKTWDNRYVCRSHKEVRNPQDFVRGVKESTGLPWSRPQTPDIFIP